MTITLTLGPHHLHLEGDFSMAEVVALTDSWFAALLELPETSARVTQTLDRILTHTRAGEAQGVQIMAKVQELSDELDAIKTAVDAVKATVAAQVDEIAALKQQITDGTPVTQDQLDSLDAKADTILASLTPGTPPAA
jgi:septal ring factor EnvC (AmiA/AmiB activator)